MEPTVIDVKTPEIGATTLFVALWTLLLWIAIGTLCAGMIGTPHEISNLGFLWLLMVGVGIVMGNYIFWEFVGKVRFSICSKRILIKNIHTLFKNEITLPIEDFRRMEFREEVPLALGLFAQGNIILHHKNGQRRFGKYLEKREALRLIRNLERAIEQYQMDNNKEPHR
ncbi:MAG: hypothetical protein LAT76_10165 [Schleiferiaceae bacterium]|nr:hypothetical protein [Schleiferiaceae bacterium]